MIQLIRIENAMGQQGFFNSRNVPECLTNEVYARIRNKHQNLPNPYDDMGIGDDFISGFHKCGYKSIEQMKEWLEPEEIRELIKLGFDIYLVSVPEENCIIGEYQIVYEPEKVVTKENINSLFN